jgi:hypothetical protein
MAYIGSNLQTGDPTRTIAQPLDADRFSGNASNTSFTLTRAVGYPTDIEVFVENIQQEPITAYTVNSTTLTFTEAPPTGTLNVYVVYKQTVGTTQVTLADGSVTYAKLANNIRLFTSDNLTPNGNNSVFTLSEPPADANTVFVTVDGVVQRAPVHYTTSGTTITFTSAPPAASNVHVRHLGFRTSTTVTAIPVGTYIPQPNIATPTITSPTITGGLTVTGNPTFTNAFDKIFSITASVASSALTVSLSSCTLDFRSSALTSGTITTVSGTPANLVISSGSTLGTISATQSRIVILALNNAGTIELAAVNISGGTQLDETNLISTTAEGGAGAADSASVVYSATARTSVAYRVVGYIESTQATAGTWATAPSTIQGYGGQALNSMSSLGYSQTWQDVSGSRAFATTYYNTTGRPIWVSVSGQGTVNGSSTVLNLLVNGTAIMRHGTVLGAGGATYGAAIDAVIPPGSYYSVTQSQCSIQNWFELR